MRIHIKTLVLLIIAAGSFLFGVVEKVEADHQKENALAAYKEAKQQKMIAREAILEAEKQRQEAEQQRAEAEKQRSIAANEMHLPKGGK